MWALAPVDLVTASNKSKMMLPMNEACYAQIHAQSQHKRLPN